MTVAAVLVAALILAALHSIGARLRFLSYIPRSGWLSFAGGTSVAYIFVHLMPELADGARLVGTRLDETLVADHLVWLLALIGLVLFYGLEVRSRPRADESAETPTVNMYRFSIAFYAVYNALIAYLLRERAEQGTVALTLFVVAMGLHFLINDFGLRERHKKRYEGSGRWVLVGAVALGATVGAFTRLMPVLIESAQALIAGGVILNVLKEELPERLKAGSLLSSQASSVIACCCSRCSSSPSSENGLSRR